MSESKDTTTLVDDTWEEMGFRLDPLRSVLLVRTHPLPTHTPGGILLPSKKSSFYGVLPHVQLITATVLSSGPKAKFQSGERVAFQRLFFAKWMEMEDKTVVGWISNEINVIGWVEGDLTYAPMAANTKPAPKAPPGLSGGQSKGTTFGGG